MSDLIDRQAAIDALDEIRHVLDTKEKQLTILPSAQPVITCDGCKFVGTYDTDFPCRNCIRREKDYYAKE